MRNALTQDDLAVWGLELNEVGGLVLFLGAFGIDDLIVDISTNVTQWRVLKIVPERVNELVSELDSGL